MDNIPNLYSKKIDIIMHKVCAIVFQIETQNKFILFKKLV